MGEDGAWAVLTRTPWVHLASTAEDGRPILRALHAVVVDGAVCFHGAPKGEKNEAVGRPAVVAAEERVANIPSWFFHPERACPATTLYRSAQVEGRLDTVEDRDAKARVLAALMARFQPEGGYRPIAADDPTYRAAVDGIAILRVRPERVAGKHALLQDKPAEVRARALAGLWRRGEPGDVEAVDAIRAERPDDADPPFLAAPAGARLRCALDATALPEALALLRGQYWNEGVFDDATIAAAHTGARAWVGAVDADGALIATMRTVSDTAKGAWIGDVAVRPDWRGRGLGRAVLRMFLDHPALRRVRRMELRTRDAMGFYAGFGFAATRTEGDRTVMERRVAP